MGGWNFWLEMRVEQLIERTIITFSKKDKLIFKKIIHMKSFACSTIETKFTTSEICTFHTFVKIRS